MQLTTPTNQTDPSEPYCFTLDVCPSPAEKTETLPPLCPVTSPWATQPHTLTYTVDNQDDCAVEVTVTLTQQVSASNPITFGPDTVPAGQKTTITKQLTPGQTESLDPAYGVFNVSFSVATVCDCESGSGDSGESGDPGEPGESGNSGNSGTSCCDTAPNTLYATFENISGCPEIDNFELELSRQGLNSHWISDSEGCSLSSGSGTGTRYLELSCDEETSPNT